MTDRPLRVTAVVALAALVLVPTACAGDTRAAGQAVSPTSSPEAGPTDAGPTEPDSPTSPAPVDITEGKSARRVLALARKALAAEAFVSVDGGGDRNGRGIDFHLKHAGAAAEIYVRFEDIGFVLLQHDTRIWMRANYPYWKDRLKRRADEFVQFVGDRWILVSDFEDADLVAEFAPRGYVDQLLTPYERVDLGDLDRFNGDDCRILHVDVVEVCLRLEDARPMHLKTRSRIDLDLRFTYEGEAIEDAPDESETVDPSELGFPSSELA